MQQNFRVVMIGSPTGWPRLETFQYSFDTVRMSRI
jgi:hypothetical protein